VVVVARRVESIGVRPLPVVTGGQVVEEWGRLLMLVLILLCFEQMEQQTREVVVAQQLVYRGPMSSEGMVALAK
jgi:hypothetical protein